MKTMRTFLTVFLALAVVAAFGQKKPNINKAKSYLEKAEYAAAKDEIDRAVEYEKTMGKAKTWYYRGMIYMALDTALSEEGAIATALESFDKALELDPEQKSFQEIDLTTGSIKNVDSKIQDWYIFYYNKAIPLYDADEWVEAGNAFEKASIVNKADTAAVLNAAICFAQTDDDASTKRNFERCAERNMVNKTVYLQLYSFANRAEDTDEALKWLKRGKELFPGDNDFTKYEINLYITSGKIDEAKRELEAAIEAEPDNPDLLFNLGVLKEESEDFEGAKAAYQKAIEVDPNHYNSLFNYGAMLYNRVPELVKEQGNLNYYPGQSRPNAAEKKKYEELGVLIDEQLELSLPVWEKLYAQKNTDENVLQTLKYIYESLGKDAEHKKISAELDAVQGN